VVDAVAGHQNQMVIGLWDVLREHELPDDGHEVPFDNTKMFTALAYGGSKGGVDAPSVI